MTRYLLGDLVRNCKEKVDRDNNPYEYFVAGDHMETERPRLTMRGRFDEADVGPAFIRLFRPGQVLYGSRRTYLKKVSVADFEGVTSNVTFVLETKDEEVLPQRLLPFLLLSDRFTSYSIGKSKGSTNPYVLFSDLADFEVDLPGPVRVAEIADVMCAAEQVKENYRSVLAACGDVVKSQFVEMFGDPTKHCGRWPMFRLDDFAQIITGNTPSRKHPEYYGEGIEWVKTDRIVSSVVETSVEQLTETGRSKARTAPAGSILMACIAGSIKSIGKVGLLDREVAFNQQINAIVPSDRVDSHFLLVMLSLSKDYLCSDVNKQLKGILNKSTLSAKRFPLPPLDTQRQFSAFVQQAAKSKFAVQKALDELNATTKKILNQELGLGDV